MNQNVIKSLSSVSIVMYFSAFDMNFPCIGMFVAFILLFVQKDVEEKQLELELYRAHTPRALQRRMSEHINSQRAR